ncbi:MAG TPA: CBS domain-containing protein [Herpetosiphonaceae bacterium]|nr:CBS domain-containing protein [Herpetosiphonaceae bacterium]
MGRLVSEVMHRGIIACSSDTSVQEVARTLTEQDVSALVVTDNEALVGIISRTDVVNARLYEQYWTQWHSLTAAHIMTKDVLTVPADASLEHAGRLLMERHIHRLVVVEERAGRAIPIGVLSLTDIVRDLATGHF